MTTFSNLGLNLAQVGLTCSLGNLLKMTVIWFFNSAKVLHADQNYAWQLEVAGIAVGEVSRPDIRTDAVGEVLGQPLQGFLSQNLDWNRW